MHLPKALDPLREALHERGFETGEPEHGLIFGSAPPHDWRDVERELVECYRLTRRAARTCAPILYVIRQGDLFGWNGSTSAMVAGALVSAARALAMEGQKRNHLVNVLSYDETIGPERIAYWIEAIFRGSDASGNLIHVGLGHIGKVFG